MLRFIKGKTRVTVHSQVDKQSSVTAPTGNKKGEPKLGMSAEHMTSKYILWVNQESAYLGARTALECRQEKFSGDHKKRTWSLNALKLQQLNQSTAQIQNMRQTLSVYTRVPVAGSA